MALEDMVKVIASSGCTPMSAVQAALLLEDGAPYDDVAAAVEFEESYLDVLLEAVRNKSAECRPEGFVASRVRAGQLAR